MARLIFTPTTSPVTLSSSLLDDPLVNLSAVNVTGTGVDAIDGTTAGTWIIVNDGVIQSAGGRGISLAGSGQVTNGLFGAASIAGSIAGVGIYGTGSVTNWGRISGRYGVALGLGGSVTNGSGGSIAASKFGVRIEHAAGTVVNAGSITATPAGGDPLAYAVALTAGGTVTNTGNIAGNENGVVIQGGRGTVTNFGGIVSTVGDSVALIAGGNVTNALGATISTAGNLAASVLITGAAGNVANSGGIIGSGNIGVLLSAGGTVTNNASASIVGYNEGVFANGAAATLINTGSISASGTNAAGVYLQVGGTVRNNARGLISGHKFGVFTENFPGSIANYGRISATTYDAVVFGKGGTLTNAKGATIVGASAGVYAKYRAAATVTNSGSITGTAVGSAGVFLDDGGDVTNNASASISGAWFGAFITGASGTIANSGSISATKYGGAIIGSGGSITNAASGSIIGGTNGAYVSSGGTVTNSGKISASGAGADFALGGSLINHMGGSIMGGSFGIFSTGAATTITNDGVVTGTHGIGLENGGQLTNHAGAVISGTTAGVFSQGGSATVFNAGIISGTASAGAALDIEAGGNVSNASSGSITGGAFGVFVTGGAGTVANAGSIAGIGNIGVDLSSGGNVSNAAGGSISASGIGVAVYGSGGTITNAGTISGAFAAVDFSNSANNLLVAIPGAVFNGDVLAGSGANTLELAQGEGASVGSIGGIGSSFTGFGSVAADSGANWTLTGRNTVGTVLNDGTLAIANGGSLDVTTEIDPASAGLFELNSGASLEIAADAGSANHIAFLAPSEAIIDAASLFGMNVGQSNYTGPLIEDFGAGDSIDLKDIAFAGITLNYTSATGLLQVASGGTDVASLLFQNSSLGVGAFHPADDGFGHTVITLS